MIFKGHVLARSVALSQAIAAGRRNVVLGARNQQSRNRKAAKVRLVLLTFYRRKGPGFDPGRHLSQQPKRNVLGHRRENSAHSPRTHRRERRRPGPRPTRPQKDQWQGQPRDGPKWQSSLSDVQPPAQRGPHAGEERLNPCRERTTYRHNAPNAVGERRLPNLMEHGQQAPPAVSHPENRRRFGQLEHCLNAFVEIFADLVVNGPRRAIRHPGESVASQLHHPYVESCALKCARKAGAIPTQSVIGEVDVEPIGAQPMAEDDGLFEPSSLRRQMEQRNVVPWRGQLSHEGFGRRPGDPPSASQDGRQRAIGKYEPD